MPTKHQRAALLAGAGLLALTAPAFAQLDEIVVTAEKREANLQDTPIAITAISNDTLDLQQVVDVTNISGMAPSLTVKPGTTNPSAAVIAIRGVSITGDEMMTQDTPNGFYVDGVLIAKSAASALEIADVDQVEVLRGPQGTLFGRNSIGGAINFKTRRPAEEAGGKVKIGFGDYEEQNISLRYDTGTIGENARLSFAFGQRERGGYVDNLLEKDDMKDPGAYDNTAGRIGFETDLTDNLSAYFTHDWSESDSYAHAYQIMAVRGDVQNFLNGYTTVDGCNLDVGVKRKDKLCLQDNGLLTNETSGSMLEVEYDMGFATLRSITSLRDWDNIVTSSDIDGFGPLTGPNSYTGFGTIPEALRAKDDTLYSTSNVRAHEQTSQEFTLLSNGGDIDWVVGFYWLDEEGSEDGIEHQWLPFVNPRARNNPGDTFRGGIEYETESDSTAIYGQVSRDLDDKMSLSFGLRYTEDTRSMKSVRPRDAAQNVEEDFSAPTGHITLNYNNSETTNSYVKLSRGYRSGGFNARSQSAAPAFDEENATALEAGMKRQSLDGRHRFNAAVHLTQYEDRQITQPVASTGGGFGTQIINASEQDISGIELEYQGLMNDNLTFHLGVGYIDVTTDGFEHNVGTPRAPNIRDISDELLTVIPQTTLNTALQYEDETQYGRLTARIAATYESEAHSFSNPYSNPFARTIASDAHTLVNAQIRLDDAGQNDGLTLTLWGTNLTDEEYIVRAIDFGPLGHSGGYYNQPATYGITLGYNF